MLNYCQIKNKSKATPADIQLNNKETSRRDEANDWEEVCIPFPIRARESNFASLVAGRSFRPEGRGLKPARNIDPDRVEVHEGDIAYMMRADRVIQSYNIATDPDYGGEAPGRVWYWTEKQWHWGEEDNTWLGFVAENFYDFINNLHPYQG